VVFIYRPFYYSRLIFAFAWIVIILLLCAWRGLLVGIRRWRWSRGIGQERILVVGGTGLGRHVMEGIVAQPDLGFALVGYLDDRAPAPVPERLNQHFRYLGPIRDLDSLLRAGGVDQVIIALPFWEHHRLPDLAAACRAAGVDFRVAPDLYELSFDRVDVGDLVGIPLIGLKEVSLRGWNLVLKRAMDLALVVLALPVVLPLSLLIAALVCGLGFVLHELAHRIVARRFGAQAHFVANTQMLLLSLVVALIPFGFFFAAPGAVWHRGYLTDRQGGLIALAGPATNLALSVLFLVTFPFVLLALQPQDQQTLRLLVTLFATGVGLNAFLGLFNMIPAGPFDGAKVLAWSPLYFGVTVVIGLLLTFVVSRNVDVVWGSMLDVLGV